MADRKHIQLASSGGSSIPREDDVSLRGGSGGGGDMEQRVAAVEKRLDAIDGKLGSLSTDLAELKGKVSMLPGYGGIALIVGVIVGLSTLAQVAAKFIPSIPAP